VPLLAFGSVPVEFDDASVEFDILVSLERPDVSVEFDTSVLGERLDVVSVEFDISVELDDVSCDGSVEDDDADVLTDGLDGIFDGVLGDFVLLLCLCVLHNILFPFGKIVLLCGRGDRVKLKELVFLIEELDWFLTLEMWTLLCMDVRLVLAFEG